MPTGSSRAGKNIQYSKGKSSARMPTNNGKGGKGKVCPMCGMPLK